MSFVGRKVNIQCVMYNVMRTVEMLSLLKIRSAVSLKRHVKNSELQLLQRALMEKELQQDRSKPRLRQLQDQIFLKQLLLLLEGTCPKVRLNSLLAA